MLLPACLEMEGLASLDFLFPQLPTAMSSEGIINEKVYVESIISSSDTNLDDVFLSKYYCGPISTHLQNQT